MFTFGFHYAIPQIKPVISTNNYTMQPTQNPIEKKKQTKQLEYTLDHRGKRNNRRNQNYYLPNNLLYL
jgi:azurin